MNETSKKRILILDTIILALLGIYLFYAVISRTFFPISLRGHSFFYPTFFILCVIKISILFLSIEENQRSVLLKKLIFGIIIAIIWTIPYFISFYEYEELRIIGILTIACIGIDYRTIIKLYVIVVGMVILTTSFCGISGCITNLVYYFNLPYVRSTWGNGYPTDFSSSIVFLCLFAWIAWKNVPDILFILASILSILLAINITHSNTSMFCSILLILLIIWNKLLDFLKDGKFKNIIKKINDIVSCIALPLFAVCMIIGTWAFHEGLSFAELLNRWNHDRLANPSRMIDTIGLSLFGNPFDNIGAGGSTFISPDYNFVDCSYLLILLRYGVLPLIMVIVLWVFMTKKALKTNDNRLALGMALIAFHSLSEQHLSEINYNILIILPLAVLFADEEKTKVLKTAESPKHYNLIRCLLVVLITTFFIPIFIKCLTLLRTVNSLKNLGSGGIKTIVLYICVAIGLISVISLIILLSKYILVLFASQEAFSKKISKKHIIIVASSLLCLIIELLIMKNIVCNGKREKEFLISSDKEALKLIESIPSCKIYVDDYPEIYKSYYDIKTGLFNGEDLARLKNVALITEIDKEYPALLYNGFQYTEISDNHCIYTNSSEAIKILTDTQYVLTDYFPRIQNISLEDIASCNKIKLLEDGSLEVTSSKPIGENTLFNQNGPYYDMTEGCYEITFNIKYPSYIEEKTELLSNIGRIELTAWYDKESLIEAIIPGDIITEEGEGIFKFTFTLESSIAGIRLSIHTSSKENSLIIQSINYKKIASATSSHDNSAQY